MLKENMEDLRIRESESRDEEKPSLPDGDFFKRLSNKASGYLYAFEKWFGCLRPFPSACANTESRRHLTPPFFAYLNR
jgi:hypothetical protein